jgi:methionyl-tRNA formyltransferase
MRLVFAGTPDFAAFILRALLQRDFDIVSVLTQPDKPAGRGKREAMSPVKVLAQSQAIAVQQPASLRHPEVLDQLRSLAADAWVVAAYGLILPAPVLALPRYGCINVHASLLPRWRGAAPIQRAIMAGDRETGISIMRMDAGLDTGPVYLRRSVPILPGDTAGSLHDRLAALGAQALCEVLDALPAGHLRPQPQPDEGVTYAAKITREDARIDWAQPAAAIERLLRALDPVPGAYTTCDGAALKLWAARVAGGGTAGAPGTVLAVTADGLEVQCAPGTLVVTQMQRAGGRRLPTTEFLRGHPLSPGVRLGT